MAAASSAVSAASGRAAASAATLAADIRLDDPATVLASAWADESAAWRALAMAWKTPLPEGEVCGRAAAAVGLSCFRTRGGLATVRQLDRPGLVYLRLRDEPPVTALLVALDERGATLQTQTRHWQVSLAGLASVWRGDFATLWRTPPGWREAYGAASAPPLPVATRTWVAERLAEAGVAGDPGQPLRDRLWAYQVAQGLPTDGRLGPVTMMQLSRGAAGLAREPVLQGAALAPMPPASAVRSPAAAVQAASAVPSAAALAAARGAATAASPTAATTAAATAASSPSGR
jgi:general secretion pathway protein A